MSKQGTGQELEGGSGREYTLAPCTRLSSGGVTVCYDIAQPLYRCSSAVTDNGTAFRLARLVEDAARCTAAFCTQCTVLPALHRANECTQGRPPSCLTWLMLRFFSCLLRSTSNEDGDTLVTTPWTPPGAKRFWTSFESFRNSTFTADVLT
jgi:hypothetical protein